MKKEITVTIEKLAELMGEQVWVKGDLKRIYIDRGYNTKKMTTKTYIYEVDGEFKVSCFIDCPSQPFQWCKSQGEEVIENVLSEIESVIIKSENPEKWENLPYRRSVKNAVKEEVVIPVTVEPVIEKTVTEPYNMAADAIGVGNKVNHDRFGIGEVIEEDKDKIKIIFTSVGEKQLLKKFCKLSKIVA